MTLNTSEKNDRKALEAELLAHGATIQGVAVICPLHPDKMPSGALYQRNNGSWAYHCHGCSPEYDGDIYDLRELRTGRKQFKADNAPPPIIEKTATKAKGFSLSEIVHRLQNEHDKVIAYLYESTTGKPLVCAMRIEDDGKKTFKQLHPSDGDLWAWGAPEKPWPLYNLRAVNQSVDCIIVEGEKSCESLISAGYCATTSLAGAGKSAYADWSSLKGKSIALWPDKDEKGIAHMRAVETLLSKADYALAGLSWIEPPEALSAKGDAYDYLENTSDGEQHNKIEELLKSATNLDGLSSLDKRISDTIDGARRAVALPFAETSRLSKALWPGTTTLLCGGPGSGKSFLLLQMLWYWISHGIKACCYELEEDVDYHLYRALVQFSGKPGLLDDDWVRVNKVHVDNAWSKYRPQIKILSQCLESSQTFAETLPMLSKWVAKKADAGYRVICIDPISVAEKSAKSWEDDRKFIRDIARITTEKQCSVVLVTHPKPGQKRYTLDDMAGGSSYQRLCQTALWLNKCEGGKTVEILSPHGSYETTCTHELALSKCRNGSGQGNRIAFDFKQLLFTEKGIMA